MRYFPQSDSEVAQMLSTIGVGSTEELFSSIPEALRSNTASALPPALSESALLKEFKSIASKNHSIDEATSFLGGGLYDHFIPSLVDYLSSRGEFLTPYTPYQPEVSQGTLQAVFEFQSMVAALSGLDVANASVYDGASAAAEAVLMAMRITRKNKIITSAWLHPDYRATVESYTRNAGLEIITAGSPDQATLDPKEIEQLLADHKNEVAALLVQSPNFAGNIEEIETLAKLVQAQGGLYISVVAEAMSLGYLRGPGELGADIFAAEGQSLGLPVQFGGPSLGLFAAKEKYLRQMPGRLVGSCPVLTPEEDKSNSGYVLTLSAREQHIRREKATSNICTNQGLMALRATIYLSLMGRRGLFAAAKQNHANATALAKEISALPGWQLHFPQAAFFNEFIVRSPINATKVIEAGRSAGVYPGIKLSTMVESGEDLLLITTTERHGEPEQNALLELLKQFS